MAIVQNFGQSQSWRVLNVTEHCVLWAGSP
jgi:hypothetical protein